MAHFVKRLFIVATSATASTLPLMAIGAPATGQRALEAVSQCQSNKVPESSARKNCNLQYRGCVSAGTDEVLYEPSLSVSIIHKEHTSESNCRSYAGGWVEVVPGTGIEAPTTACVEAAGRSSHAVGKRAIVKCKMNIDTIPKEIQK